jgi:hypothetical protein
MLWKLFVGWFVICFVVWFGMYILFSINKPRKEDDNVNET